MIDQGVDITTPWLPVMFRARERARALGRAVLVSRTQRSPFLDPTAAFTAARSIASDRAYLERPDARASLVGIGRAWAFESGPGDRQEDIARAWSGLLADADVDEQPDLGPRLIGGFAFDSTRATTALWRGFPAARFVLPNLALTGRDDGCWLTLNALIAADSDPEALIGNLVSEIAQLSAGVEAPPVRPPPPAIETRELLPSEQWRAVVARARTEIGRGLAEKIVLARAISVRASQPIDLAAALRHLRAGYPTCAIFAIARGDSCFLGATPERLVRVHHDEVRVSCLAGTMARGANEAEDERLGSDLLGSHKNRAEHALVVRELVDQLVDGVADLEVPPEPTLLRVRNVQHLYTPLRGQLRPNASLLQLTERLHPTPAVGGRPRGAALTFIRDQERLDRGWYAGPIGWVDARGEGEMVVGLRSGLVRGAEVTLFAGCGIVAESDPDAEFAESQLKFAPMLAALGWS